MNATASDCWIFLAASGGLCQEDRRTGMPSCANNRKFRKYGILNGALHAHVDSAVEIDGDPLKLRGSGADRGCGGPAFVCNPVPERARFLLQGTSRRRNIIGASHLIPLFTDQTQPGFRGDDERVELKDRCQRETFKRIPAEEDTNVNEPCFE